MKKEMRSKQCCVQVREINKDKVRERVKSTHHRKITNQGERERESRQT